MVRVISVHHFVSQDIHTCEDPVAAVVAPPERLLLALPQHVIEVRDLARGGDVSFTFPSVDQVHHMLHCCNGNYVATLETKQTRQGQETMYARVYANWDVMTQVQQPMRARIAGRVTPSSAQSGPPSLEMIELPLKRTPHIIACCQSTGNLLVASHCNLLLYHYVVRTHDISRLRFLDFEEASFSVELSFRPTWMSLAEDFVMTGSRERVHLFQFVYKDMPNSYSTGQQKHDFRTRNPSRGTSKGRDHAINDNNNNNSNKKTCIDLDALLNGQLSPNDVRLHPNSFPLVVELPSIAAERAANSVSPSSSGSSPSTSVATQRQTPFQVASSDMNVTIKYANSAALPWTKIREVVHLLQLQIIGTPQQANGILYTENHDEFRGVIMKPIYLSASERLLEQRKCSGPDHNPLHSCHFGMLASIECIVVTQQEGYHYHFSLLEHNERKSKAHQSACVTVYPFTAHVQGIAMERFFLHALTETGLETYTVRVGHHLAAELGVGGAVVSPPLTDPICLVGLRPFLGVEHLLLAESHIVLLACSEGSSLSSQDSQGGGGWTLYSLALPHPSACYRDMFAVGSVHRWTSPTTYSHLLGEGHMLLRVALNTITWHPGGASESTVPAELDPVERNRLEGLYQESCALLADYHISCETEEDWKLARPYYIMAGLTPIQVVERVSNMKVEFEGDSDSQKKKHHLHGLIVYLRQSLIALSHETGDILFSPTLPSFAHTLLDLFEELDPSQVSTIVLHSSLLRECATDRVLGIMKKQLKTRAIPETTDALALVLLCIQKGSPDQALAVLQSLSSSGVNDILLENPTLLIESGSANVPSSLSELAALLMDSKPVVLASVLKELVTKSNLYTLEQVLKMFMDYIPSRIGISGSLASQALQLFLEHYFAWYFSAASGKLECTAATTEALKILVRSYLSDLQRYELTPTGLKRELHDPNSENNEKVLCEGHRFVYLSKMPPFAPDLSQKLISLQEGSSSDDTKSISKAINKDMPNCSLFKLQCLLSYAQLPHECLAEVHKCVQTNPRLYGSLSLQVLCVPTREAVSILLDFCPQAALQFAKERFVNEAEWKYLVFLLHRKVQSLEDENLLKPFYMQIRKDVLTHLAQTMPLEVLGRLLPPGEESTYHAYMQICQQVTHANHIRALIMATGQQLLSTLNLLTRIHQETGLTNKTELLKMLSTVQSTQSFPTGKQAEK